MVAVILLAKNVQRTQQQLVEDVEILGNYFEDGSEPADFPPIDTDRDEDARECQLKLNQTHYKMFLKE